MVLAGFVGGFGSFWVVLGGFGWFRVLETTASGFLPVRSAEFFQVPCTGDPQCVYGDPAHPIRAHLQRPLRGRSSDPSSTRF